MNDDSDILSKMVAVEQALFGQGVQALVDRVYLTDLSMTFLMATSLGTSVRKVKEAKPDIMKSLACADVQVFRDKGQIAIMALRDLPAPSSKVAYISGVYRWLRNIL